MKQKLYSEKEAILKSGFTLKQLEERVKSGLTKSVIVNGKKYYRLNDSEIRKE